MTSLKLIFQFIFLVTLQVLVLNNVEFAGYMNPYLYIVFIIMLPANMNRNLLLLIGFLLGFCIDIFEDSGALHASATLLIAFARPFFFRLMAGPANVEMERMNIQTLGTARFLVLASFIVLLHHFWLFTLEAFSFREIGQILQRTIFSGIFTLFLIYLAQILVYRNTK